MLSNVSDGGNISCLLYAMSWARVLQVRGWQIWCARKRYTAQPRVCSDHTDVLIPEEENAKWSRDWTWKRWQWEKHWSRHWKPHFLARLPWERTSLPSPSGRQDPTLGLALILSFPHHMPKPHRKVVSLPSYLCLLATLLFMPSPCLTPFLPAVTVSWLLPSGAFREQLQSSGVAQADGDGDRVLVGCVDPETAVISTWFLNSSSSALAASWQMLALMALIFSPLPPSWGVPAPLHILWQLGLWTSCGRFGLSYFLLPDCSSSFLLSHKTYLSTERLLRPVRRRQSHQPHKLRDVIPRSRSLVCPAPTVVVAFYLCPVMFFRLHPPSIGLVMAAKKRHTFSLFKKTQKESGNVTEESWLDRKRSCVLWKF